MGVEFDLNGVAGGALRHKVNQAFQKVIQNMSDVNTSFGDKREITLKITFSQNEERTKCDCKIDVRTKLASPLPVNTIFYTDKDLDTGEVYASEFGSSIPGQTTFKDLGITTSESGDTVDTNTGEILSQNDSVVDLRQKRKKA